MAEDTLVSFRLSPGIKAAALRKARRDGLSFSDILRILLQAYVKGDIVISISARQRKSVRS